MGVLGERMTAGTQKKGGEGGKKELQRVNW